MARAKSPVDKSLVDRSPVRHRGRRGIAGFLAFLLTLGLVGLGGPTTPAAAEPAPVQPPTTVWSARTRCPRRRSTASPGPRSSSATPSTSAANFTSARPAGAAAGPGETPRTQPVGLHADHRRAHLVRPGGERPGQDSRRVARRPRPVRRWRFTSINGVSRYRHRRLRHRHRHCEVSVRAAGVGLHGERPRRHCGHRLRRRRLHLLGQRDAHPPRRVRRGQRRADSPGRRPPTAPCIRWR